MLSQLLATLVVGIGSVSVGCLAERRWPAQSQHRGSTTFNIGYFTAASLLQALSTPVLAGLTAVAVNRLGGGLLLLASRGWGLVPSVFVYVLVMDYGEYLFHRAQHHSPFLWAMHALHHSDASLNVSTTIRHAWPEHLLKTVTIYLLTGLLFRVNGAVISIYATVSLYNYFVHSNVRVGLGRWAWIINSPQYHRLHHSRLAQHIDCNFAALLPIYDVIFGSYRRPHRGEYPPSGLDLEDGPANVAGAILWPLRIVRKSSPR